MNRFADRDWGEPVRYPDPAVEPLDPRFEKYMRKNAGLERIWTGGRWNEGPVWFGDQRALIWSDIPNNRMMRWFEDTGEVSVYRKPSNYSNGNTRDRQGRLVTCEHGRQVTRTEIDGTVTVLQDSFDGKRLNAPNDLVVHPDGGIWFTDPGYGILTNYEGSKADFELPPRIYRIDPETLLSEVVDETLKRPNGIAFSPDCSLLYAVDSDTASYYVFDVADGKVLKNRRLFSDFGDARPDGFRVDTDGNLWASAAWSKPELDGVHILAPDGTKIGAIHTPEGVSNVVFGGVKRNRLFMTASQSIYSIYMETQGIPYG